MVSRIVSKQTSLYRGFTVRLSPDLTHCLRLWTTNQYGDLLQRPNLMTLSSINRSEDKALTEFLG